MGRHNIEKYSYRYASLKTLVGFWHNTVFYRRIVVLNKENIPRDGHNIFTPNHQNALMDAMAVLLVRRWQPVFLARSDIYKKNFIAKLLYFLKILPVYRIRDGYETLKNNEEIFQKTIDVIRNQNGLVVLPEGNHDGHRRLRQLKKGVARIAFQTEESTGYQLGINIVPVGINYSHYQKFRHVLTVNFGEPIPVSSFYEDYRENNVKGINTLMAAVSEGMKKVMVHIETETYYNLYENLLEVMLQQRWYSPKEDLLKEQELVQKLNELLESQPEKLEELQKSHETLKQGMEKHDIRYWLLRKGPFTFAGLLQRFLVLIVGFPVFLAGVIPNAPVFLLPLRVSRKIKDPQFVSSINFGISFALFLIFYLLYILLLLLFGVSWWLSLLLVASLIPLGLLAFMYSVLWKKIRGSLLFTRKRKKHAEEFRSTKEAYQQLLKQVKTLMKDRP